ncbi:hypothetical protein ISCGN_019226 [Ixodes scapularis]
MTHSPSLYLQILFLVTTPTFDAAPPPTVPATPDVLRQQEAAEGYPTHPPKLDALLPFHWQSTATALATGSLYNEDPRTYLMWRDTIGMAHSPSLYLQILFLITTPTFDAAPPPTAPATPDVLRQQEAAEDYPTHPPKLDASLPFHWQPTATASATGSLYNEDPRTYLLGRDTIGMAHSPSLYSQILFLITTPTFDAAPPPTAPATPDVLRQQQAAEDYPTHPPKLDASLPFHWQPTATASATGSLYNEEPRTYLLGRDTIGMAHSPSLYLQAFLFCCGLASPAGLPPPLRCPATASSSPSLSDLMPVPSRLPEPYLLIDIGVALRSVTSPSAGAINTGLQHFQFIGHGEVKPTTMLTESVLFVVQAFLFCCGLASPAGLPPPLRCPATASSSPSLSDLMPVPSRLPEPYLLIDIGVALRSVTSPSAGAINTGLQHFQFIGHGEVKPTTMLTESVLFVVQDENTPPAPCVLYNKQELDDADFLHLVEDHNTRACRTPAAPIPPVVGPRIT